MLSKPLREVFIACLVICFVTLDVVPSVFAIRPGLRFVQGNRVSLRDKKDIPSEVLGRAEMELVGKGRYQILPFVEARRNLDRSSWSRIELGTEIGTQMFPWFYLGQGVHHVWISPGDDHPEWEIRTLLSTPLSPWKVRSQPLTVYALNEYTYDLAIGTGIRNEVAAGLKVPLPIPHFHLLLGWRHIDLIHATDTDQFEGSLEAEF